MNSAEMNPENSSPSAPLISFYTEGYHHSFGHPCWTPSHMFTKGRTVSEKLLVVCNMFIQNRTSLTLWTLISTSIQLFLSKIPTLEHKFSLLLTLLFLLLSLQAQRENESKADKKGCPLNRQYSLINIHFHPRSTFK